MRTGIVGIALLVLAGAGAYELRARTARVDPAAAAAIQARMDAIPKTIGDWIGEDRDYDARQQDRTGSFAALHRMYRNAKTNETVAVLILAGPAQEIGAHDPNRCYVGAGYRPVGAAVRKSAPEGTLDGPCGYWIARFDTDTFPAASLQVLWAWSTDGRWIASDNARYDFVREPALYKIYISRRITAVDADEVDPTERLVTEFFPAVRTGLAAN
jgi:hypothetical protein